MRTVQYGCGRSSYYTLRNRDLGTFGISSKSVRIQTHFRDENVVYVKYFTILNTLSVHSAVKAGQVND